MTKKENFFPEFLPYWIEFHGFSHAQALSAIDWCKTVMCDEFDWTIHPDYSDSGGFVYKGVFFFLDERDAAFFSLKWL
jgi:hypothetical protein